MKVLSYFSAAYLLGYVTGAFTFLFLMYVYDYFKCYEEIFMGFYMWAGPGEKGDFILENIRIILLI